MQKILIIEDDYNLRININELLDLEGYETEYAENGKAGLEKIYKFLPDLIICDVMMPEMNGFELLEILIKDPEKASIPLIFLTAKTEYENLRKGMKLGAEDYLFKPFDINDLLEVIKVRLRKRIINESKIKEIQEQISLKFPND